MSDPHEDEHQAADPLVGFPLPPVDDDEIPAAPSPEQPPENPRDEYPLLELDEEGKDRFGVTWLTVVQAAELAGVQPNTIRRWYSGNPPDVISRLAPGPTGPQRVVPYATLLLRAQRTRPNMPLPPPPSSAPATPVAAALPPDTLPIPRDAWDRMLEQLGNLHTAGQQLAEARERAAKAETEALFLRDQLAEARAERDRAREEAPPAAPMTEATPPPPDTGATSPRRVLTDVDDVTGGRLRRWWRR